MDHFSRPLTVAQARAAGLTRGQLAGPAYQRLLHGVYAPAGPVDLWLRVEAARLVLPGTAVATGRTALRLLGLDVGADFPLTFVTRERARSRHAGIALSVVEELPEHRNGIASAAEACAFVLDAEPVVPAVTVVDRALRLGMTTPTGILTSPLTGRARAAYAHVDTGAHSPRETLLRLALTHAGLPRPESQGRVLADGALVAQVDLLYRRHRVAIEYEGGQHLSDPAQWNKDIKRYADLARLGHTVVRVTAARMREPDSVVTEVYRALTENGYRGPAPRFTAPWWLAFGGS